VECQCTVILWSGNGCVVTYKVEGGPQSVAREKCPISEVERSFEEVLGVHFVLIPRSFDGESLKVTFAPVLGSSKTSPSNGVKLFRFMRMNRAPFFSTGLHGPPSAVFEDFWRTRAKSWLPALWKEAANHPFFMLISPLVLTLLDEPTPDRRRRAHPNFGSRSARRTRPGPPESRVASSCVLAVDHYERQLGNRWITE